MSVEEKVENVIYEIKRLKLKETDLKVYKMLGDLQEFIERVFEGESNNIR